MISNQLDFKRATYYVPHILLVGLGIGTTNYIIHGEFNWFQWAIQSSLTSFLIGYSLLWIASNKGVFEQRFSHQVTLYLVLGLLFCLIGLITTEIELLFKTLIFQNKPYQPFSSGNLYLSNSIISIALGFSFFLNGRLFQQKEVAAVPEAEDLSLPDDDAPSDTLTNIPVKQGKHIRLMDVHDIVYFEAFDNYSHLFDIEGNKVLCDYSLIFLEKRLDKAFLRIHRKYLVNTRHIKQIEPYLNGRYVIQFNQANLDTITSSKGYLKTMRRLVKIE